jgi:hypothetical protein
MIKNIDEKMKIKHILIPVLVYCLSFLCTSVQAQGLFNNNGDNADDIVSPLSVLRGGPTGSGGPGTSGDGDQKGEPGKDSDTAIPVGEGVLLLTFLASGYAALKKKQHRKTKI